MSWIYTDDDSNKTKYRMQSGWFWDPISNYREWDDDLDKCIELTPVQVPDLYLFSPDGQSYEAKGTPGMTVASNQTEVLDCFGKTYIESGVRYDNRGDTITFDLNLEQTTINGWPKHPLNGQEAPGLRMSDEVEGLYFESSNHNDSITINVNDENTRLRSFFLRGYKGDDTLTFNGDFSAVSSYWWTRDGVDTDQELIQSINFENAFVGDEGYDKLVINSDSSLFRLEYLDDVNYFGIPEDEIVDLNSQFALLGPGDSNFHGVDIEEIIFSDISFKMKDIILANEKSKILLGGNKNNYLHGNALNNKIKSKSGDDILSGGDGKDKLLAGNGNDTLIYEGDNFRDKFSGGSGIDTVSAASANPVFIDLTKGIVHSEMDPTKTKDKLSSIENAIGSTYADTIIGNSQNNVIFSNGGSDNISSGAGDDTIHLKVDDNAMFRADLNGGEGTDALYINELSSNFQIISDGDSLYTTQLLSPSKSEFFDIYITNIEKIHFTDNILDTKTFGI